MALSEGREAAGEGEHDGQEDIEVRESARARARERGARADSSAGSGGGGGGGGGISWSCSAALPLEESDARRLLEAQVGEGWRGRGEREGERGGLCCTHSHTPTLLHSHLRPWRRCAVGQCMCVCV